MNWRVLILAFCLGFEAIAAAADRRPNILWFVVDDMSADFACYGQTLIETPHVDRLAREGVRFTRAHVTAPVCSTCRSAFMIGMHQATVGSHHHRTTGADIRLPRDIAPLPILFQRAGYFTCNGDGLRERPGKVRTKTDYNFIWDAQMYDGIDWSQRSANQPFFMQVQLAGGKLRGSSMNQFERTTRKAKSMFGRNVDASKIDLPPYYPDDKVFRRDWAAYLESVRLTDHHVGSVLARLEEEGILDKTLIIFMTDHGISHARGKQFNYHEGTHIPFIVRGPINGNTPSRRKVREDLIEHIDMAAISLAAAGIQLPDSMHAQNVFADDYQPREAVFTARDRCDETIDFIRSCRTARFLYVRNYQPFRPLLQPSRYKDNKVLLKRLREMRNRGQLTDLQMSLLFSPQRAGEELYDLAVDPYETKNVAGDPQYEKTLAEMRSLLDEHLIRTRDAGFLPEPLIASIAGGAQTVHAFCSSNQNYPIAEVVALANLASRRSTANLATLLRRLQHTNPVMRYWAALGLRVLGTAAAPAQPALETALQDPDPSVRITAAAALGSLGDKQTMSRFLVREAKNASNDAQALWALDALKYLDMPQAINGHASEELVKGQYSSRAFNFLSKGGLVFGSGTDYWNP